MYLTTNMNKPGYIEITYILQYPITYITINIISILDLQPISRELLDNVARPPRLMPTIELIKYSFVPHHQHGRRPGQEL